MELEYLDLRHAVGDFPACIALLHYYGIIIDIGCHIFLSKYPYPGEQSWLRLYCFIAGFYERERGIRMQRKRNINLILLVLMTGLVVYFLITFIKQQEEISIIKSEMRFIEQKIVKGREIREDLIEQANQADTEEFIEKIAREKLGMVKEGERLYIDSD